jgi:ABC-type nitrate/sulfonate/bicarbonate transport system substrate-binding protein
MTQDFDHLPAVRVNVFPGGFNWGLYAGQDKGFFAKHGLSLRVQNTANSVSQMTELASGKFDIAMTAVDNIVAYVEGQGEAPIGPQPEFFAFMGSDSGFLNLIASPYIETIPGLAGKTLSVDALTTGYAFVLYEIMRRNGLEKDKGDYRIVSAGGMIQRWNALREGQHLGTLLSSPYNIIAKSEGFSELAKATEVIGAYLGNAGAARRSWAAQNRFKVTAFIRGYQESIAWLYQPCNRAEAIEILCRHLPQMAAAAAEASFTELLHPERGFFQTGKLDPQAIGTVLELRSRYGKPPKQLSDPLKYYDLSYWNDTR